MEHSVWKDSVPASTSIIHHVPDDLAPFRFNLDVLRFQSQATSLGCGYLNEKDEEILAVTVDHIQLRKKAKERKVKFAVHHFQKPSCTQSATFFGRHDIAIVTLL